MAIADKLQKLIDGKQYVVDKTNAKAETSLPINCTWEEIGDVIESILGGGGSGIVEVVELPTENVQEDTLYKVNEVSDINVWVKAERDSEAFSLEELVEDLGVTPNITYYVVDSLPTNPNVSDLATFSQIYVYIYNDIGYVYANAGYGEMWLDLATLTTSMSGGITFENKGYIDNVREINFPLENGVYVTYKLGKYGLVTDGKYNVETYNDEWFNYKKIYEDFIFRTTTNFLYERTKILDYMFYMFESLTNVDMPNAKQIGKQAFYGCINLSNVDFSKIEFIDYYAFYNCKNITDINAPMLLEYDIYGNRSEGGWFSGSGVVNANLPKITNLPEEVFYNCINLKNVNLPLVEQIGESCFNHCINLETLYLPKADIIGMSSFRSCHNLKNINLPNVTALRLGAFSHCYNLESIYLPKLTKMSYDYSWVGHSEFVFAYCHSLKAIIIGQSESVCPLNRTVDFFVGLYHFKGQVDEEYNPNGDKDGYIYVPDNLVNDYKVAENWSTFATQIKPLSELPQEYKTLYGI